MAETIDNNERMLRFIGQRAWGHVEDTLELRALFSIASGAEYLAVLKNNGLASAELAPPDENVKANADTCIITLNAAETDKLEKLLNARNVPLLIIESDSGPSQPFEELLTRRGRKFLRALRIGYE